MLYFFDEEFLCTQQHNTSLFRERVYDDDQVQVSAMNWGRVTGDARLRSLCQTLEYSFFTCDLKDAV
jgi:hypothetical protein